MKLARNMSGPAGADSACTASRALLRGARGRGKFALAVLGSRSQGAAAGTQASFMSVRLPSSGWARQQQHARRGAAQLVRSGASVAEKYSVAGRTNYRFHSKDGALIDVCVEAGERSSLVSVSVSYENMLAGPTQDQVQLHWGMYRASPSKWAHPREAVPQGSSLDEKTGGMRTPLAQQAHDGRQGAVWSVKFDVPAKIAPVQLAFSLYYPGTNKYDTPRHHPHFCVPVGMSVGTPAPLGASVVAAGQGGPREATSTVNFSVFTRHAQSMHLSLVRLAGPPSEGGHGAEGGAVNAKSVLDIALDPLTNKTGDVWHVSVQGLTDLETLCWGWRADGNILWDNGNRFHPGFILMDPYSTLALRCMLPENAHATAPRMAPTQDLTQPVALGSLAPFVQAPFAWQGAQTISRSATEPTPSAPLRAKGKGSRVVAVEDSVMVFVDIDGFTYPPGGSPAPGEAWPVPPERRGKFLGVLDRVPDILAAGATTVVLSPVALQGRSGLPLALFAPEPRHAVGPAVGAGQELQQLVAGLHAAGLEVLMQVEYCLTGEGGDASQGRLQGLRGLDHPVYYRGSTGGGSADELCVLNNGHPVVRRLVLDSLRHWAGQYCVDGFVFRRAENLTQDKFGAVLDNPPLAEEIAQDPMLSRLKLIAGVQSPQLLPRGGERGFPHWATWMQLNDRFREDVLSYLAFNAHGKLSALATRIVGSPDLFAARWDAGLPGGLAVGRQPGFGVNLLTPLDQNVSLQQLVDPNGENASRSEALARALLLVQFMSLGAPALPGASLTSPSMRAMAGLLALLRRTYRELLSPPTFDSPRTISWLSPFPGAEPDWSGTSPAPSNVMVLHLQSSGGRCLLLAVNPYSEQHSVGLPPPPMGMAWRCVVDTLLGTTTAASGNPLQGPPLPAEAQSYYTLGPLGGVILDCVKAPTTPSAGSAASPGIAAATARKQQ